MKIIFNDASELEIQQARIDTDGALKIKFINQEEEKLKEVFQDKEKTKRLHIVERGEEVATYEKYIIFEGITKYNDGILEPFLYKEGETPEERVRAAEEKAKAAEEEAKIATEKAVRAEESLQMSIAELTMTIASMMKSLTGEEEGASDEIQ